MLVVPSDATADSLLTAGAAADRIVVIEEGLRSLPRPTGRAAADLLDRRGVSGPFLLTVSTVEPPQEPDPVAGCLRPDLGCLSPGLVVVGPVGWGRTLASASGVVLAGRVPSDAVLCRARRAGSGLPLRTPVRGVGPPCGRAMAAGLPAVLVVSPARATALAVEPTGRRRHHRRAGVGGHR